MENPKLCFMALSILAIPMFVKPALVASYHFVFVMFPRVCEKLLAWLTPSILYVFINFIILAILANSSLQRSLNITGSSLEEHKPWAETAHYQRHQPEEPIYEEESTATSEWEEQEAEVEECIAKSEWEEEEAEVEESTATSELEEEEAEESTTTSELEEEEAEVSSAAKAITEGRGSPLRRHFQKSENWETVHRADATDASSRDSSPYSSSAVYRKSETWSNGGNRTDNVGGRGEFGVGLKKEASLSLEELNRQGRGSPLRRHFQKSENWETVHRADATDAASRDTSPYSSSPSPVYRKSETWSNGGNRTDNVGGRGEFGVGLKKEASLSLEELNRQVEAFIAKVKNDMKLQRE